MSNIDKETDAKGAVPPTPTLPPSVTVIDRDGDIVFLVGTAHISKKSVEEVREVISAVDPDTVCVELCKTRYETLTDTRSWEKLDIFQVIRQKKVLLLLSHLALGSYQRRLGDRFGVKPGAELLAAVEAAREAGAELRLSDRDVQITLTRAWRNLGLWSKMKLLSVVLASVFTRQELTEEDIENLKEKDHLSEALSAFAEAFPKVKEPLIDERDDYLMESISTAPGKRIVAVVGAGHVPGIAARFGRPVDRGALEEIPPPGWLGRSLKWLIPAIVLGAFAVGIKRHDLSALDQMILAWALPNALFAGLGTIIAGAKPLTILTTIIASPITSLNPTINAGIVGGMLEAWLRRPTVDDCQRVQDDVRSLRGVYRNRFTRVLLVSAMATMGSALGAYAGATWLVKLVAGY